MKIAFFGTTSFGVPALDSLATAGHEIVGIVSRPAQEKGRGLKIIESDIVLHSRKTGYGPVLCPHDLRSDQFVQELKSCGADLFIVVAFRILPEEIFSMPPFGTYNIHASLLPRFRGPAPIQRAIATGETETGVTVFRIDRGIDTGNIVLQKKVAIASDETFPQLSERLSLAGAECIVEAVALIQANAVVFQKQDSSRASGAPKLVKSEGKIDWDQNAQDICNMIRAFTPFPAAYAFFNGMRLNVERAVRIDTGSSAEAPGTILSVGKDGLDVQCKSSVLRVLQVKPEGKKSMSSRDFALGRNLTKGMRLT